MTSHLHPVPSDPALPFERPRPGGAVTHDELTRFAELAGQGESPEAIAEQTGRARTTVTKYLRLMLPLDERGCPDALLGERLSGHLSTGDYDWRTAMTHTPPPPPIKRIERAGIPGLSDPQLITLALALADQPGRRFQMACDELLPELHQRHLGQEVLRARKQELVRSGLSHEQAGRAAALWCDDHFDLHVSDEWFDWRPPYSEPRWYDREDPFES